MLLGCLIALGALVFAGVGHAAAARRSTAPHRAVAVHHRAVAYADGSLTVARRSPHTRLVPVAHANVRTAMVVAAKTPAAYADGVLTVARHHHQRRQILAHAA